MKTDHTNNIGKYLLSPFKSDASGKTAVGNMVIKIVLTKKGNIPFIL